MTRRGAAIALALCAGGCDYLFQIDHVSLRNDAKAQDGGKLDGALPAMCPATVVDDDFDGAMLCPWGVPFGGTYVTSGGGHLTIDPPSDAYSGGCNAPVGPFADGGIVAEMTKVIGGSAYAYTGIQEFGTFDASLLVNSGELKLEHPDGAPVWAHIQYDPTTMRWLRMRPDRKASSIVAEYSSDGAMWNELGFVGVTTVPVDVRPVLIGGVAPGAPTVSGVAEFSRFIVCQ